MANNMVAILKLQLLGILNFLSYLFFIIFLSLITSYVASNVMVILAVYCKK